MSDNALAELNGFLHAFELLNLGADHESTFRLERLFEVGGDAHLSLSKHLQPSNYEFSFLEDKNWRTSLSSELKRCSSICFQCPAHTLTRTSTPVFRATPEGPWFYRDFSLPGDDQGRCRGR